MSSENSARNVFRSIWFTDRGSADANVLYDFVLTYRSFATPFEVVDALVKRYARLNAVSLRATFSFRCYFASLALFRWIWSDSWL